ncbi:MAG: hypothetical protein J5545_03815 [Bacteroidaceae bacterium]|nr:hypothetical protein [Bacteroidaceae bacterium]
MKKTYIQPELLIVKTVHHLPLCSSPLGKYNDETLNSGDILVKYNWGSFWDEWAGAAGE